MALALTLVLRDELGGAAAQALQGLLLERLPGGRGRMVGTARTSLLEAPRGGSRHPAARLAGGPPPPALHLAAPALRAQHPAGARALGAGGP